MTVKIVLSGFYKWRGIMKSNKRNQIGAQWIKKARYEAIEQKEILTYHIKRESVLKRLKSGVVKRVEL